MAEVGPRRPFDVYPFPHDSDAVIPSSREGFSPHFDRVAEEKNYFL